MARYSLQFDPAALTSFLRTADGPIGKDLERRAINVVALAKHNASGRPGPNVDTGRLRASIHQEEVEVGPEGLRIRITADVEYASFVELGTDPHLILPKNKAALFWPGADYPVAVVHHPGSRAYPFLKPALEAAVV